MIIHNNWDWEDSLTVGKSMLDIGSLNAVDRLLQALEMFERFWAMVTKSFLDNKSFCSKLLDSLAALQWTKNYFSSIAPEMACREGNSKSIDCVWLNNCVSRTPSLCLTFFDIPSHAHFSGAKLESVLKKHTNELWFAILHELAESLRQHYF